MATMCAECGPNGCLPRDMKLCEDIGGSWAPLGLLSYILGVHELSIFVPELSTLELHRHFLHFLFFPRLYLAARLQHHGCDASAPEQILLMEL